MRRRGRPTKLTPEVSDQIIKALRIGSYQNAAAESAGIDEVTLCRWMERGKREQSGIYSQFRQDVKRAEHEAQVSLLAIIRKAATREKDPQWTAAAWILERRHPELWGRKDRIDGNFDIRASRSDSDIVEAGGHKIDLKKLTDDQLRDLDRILATQADTDKALPE